MCTMQQKYICPRLLDYVVICGSRHPNRNNNVAQTPELLRRYPVEDHKDFPLPNDVVFFCQPEGCINVGPKRMSLRETTSFVFTLTEKDSGIVRYGVCVNFFRPFERKIHSSERARPERLDHSGSTSSGDTSLNIPGSEQDAPYPRSPRTKRKLKTACRVRNNTLTSLCIISHHPFFSTFRECLFILRRLIEACHDRSCTKRIGGSKGSTRDTVWGVLTGQGSDSTPGLVMHEVREIETWILRLLSAPVPVPSKTRVEVQVLPRDLQPPLLFALPDHTRFGLVDFPLHLPLELLGVDTCLKVLTCIILEHKLVLQSRDYNALSMSVMAFVSMLYPMEYMFPVIPLLPTCMSSAEQLLLAPTPYIIGVPASFLMYKRNFGLPNDVWLVDLDSNKIHPAQGQDLPPLPDPEGTQLKNHLKQALASMSMTPQPIKNLDALAQNPDMWKRRESFSSQTGFNPLIYGNDIDSVDVATRVAMVRFFNSANILGNFAEHTRTLRLYPRPVVAFQLYSFLKSRPVKTHFTARIARTQAVEYFAEWSLSPDNVVFLRIQTGVYDPALIGDKPKWYAHQLQCIDFQVYDENSSLSAALASTSDMPSDDNPTDESGSDSDGADSTSSSYSSLSDFVTDIVNSEIDGDTPAFYAEDQVLAVESSKVFMPPSQLQVPDTPVTHSDSAFSMPESDLSSDESSSPTYSQEQVRPPEAGTGEDPPTEEKRFVYDSGNVSATSRSITSSTEESTASLDLTSSTSDTPPTPGVVGTKQHPLAQPLNKSANSAFDKYEKPPKSPQLKAPPKTSGHHPPPLLTQQSLPASLPPAAHSSPRVSPQPGLLSSLGQSGARLSPSSGSNSSRKPGLKPLSDSERSSTPTSIISTISNELTDIAQSTSNTISEFFGSNKQERVERSMSSPGIPKPNKPFAPLGNRKALVEKSGLVKHATSRKQKDTKHTAYDSRTASNSENQQFLKEVITSVMDGQGLSIFKQGRVKKLMEDENYRNFVVSRLNKNLDRKLCDDDPHIDDVPLTKQVYRGMLSLMKAIVHGLEVTYQNHGLGGMASAYMLLEIAHTHFWQKDLGSNKSDISVTPEIASPYGSRESLTSKGEDSPQKADLRHLHEEQIVASMGVTDKPRLSATSSPATHTNPGWWSERSNPSILNSDQSSSSTSTESGSPVIVNGDEFENIEIQTVENLQALQNASGTGGNQTTYIPLPPGKGTSARDLAKAAIVNNNTKAHPRCNIVVTQADQENGNLHQGDILREMVKNKELMNINKQDKMKKFSSLDSEVSEASTLVSTSSDNPADDGKRRSRITHHPIRGAMSDSEMEMAGVENLTSQRNRSSSIWSSKSNLSTGFRYHEGKMLNTSPLPSPDTGKTYLFEGLIMCKDRSRIWDQMQFWEDMFLDAVAQERDIIGMDQGPAEMMERYNSLGGTEKKRLEHDEDKLLSVMLYNLVGFMIMTNVSKQEIKKKVRRLLGKCHIGLAQSQHVNDLLDQIHNLYGNDVDLKPMGSRMMQKQSFTVHWGSDNTGDMLFMEVCDDCLILRSVTGAICDRWWYEKLVNMTYCPKTKVLCLWRKSGDKVQLNQFYTKKCRELYFCVKESMEKAASRNNGKLPGQELGGEFPVQDLKTGQGGLLQVCMEGIGLLFANSKFFIELSHIRKCFTQKGGIFILEECDPKTKTVVQRRYRSTMADQICYAVLCVFSYIAAGMEQRK
ncbi:MAP kinase-activating death domain protein-like isoform X3 [Liolophura sinensis]|uniref:MAP kinase-activating death domain protein-like isoform X3 n=1 Tax=Liolophura sinensis TaxID=3198878 RepID=UPI0031590AD1